jgi:hypothetical protein
MAGRCSFRPSGLGLEGPSLKICEFPITTWLWISGTQGVALFFWWWRGGLGGKKDFFGVEGDCF